jgi:hypothetical protein
VRESVECYCPESRAREVGRRGLALGSAGYTTSSIQSQRQEMMRDALRSVVEGED